MTVKSRILSGRDSPELRSEAAENPSKNHLETMEDNFASELDSPWEFLEPQSCGSSVTCKLDIWVLPIRQSHSDAGLSAGIVTLFFRYYHDEFLDNAWLRA